MIWHERGDWPPYTRFRNLPDGRKEIKLKPPRNMGSYSRGGEMSNKVNLEKEKEERQEPILPSVQSSPNMGAEKITSRVEGDNGKRTHYGFGNSRQDVEKQKIREARY